MSPIWKTKNPPCEAHVILSKMFEQGKIAANASPTSVQKMNAAFQGYSAAVFANHFKELRAQWGVACK